MNAATGEWQLQTVKIRYSETGGSSLGFRFFKTNLLQEWQSRNPTVKVVLIHSLYQHPSVTATYKNGEETTCNIKNLSAKRIDDLLNHYRNSSSPNLYLRHGGPRVWTEKRSIQGVWQPNLECALKQIKWFHKSTENVATTPKYSATSLALGKQHREGKGRWGDQIKTPKGFDSHLLSKAFKNPFISPQGAVTLMKRLVK